MLDTRTGLAPGFLRRLPSRLCILTLCSSHIHVDPWTTFLWSLILSSRPFLILLIISGLWGDGGHWQGPIVQKRMSRSLPVASLFSPQSHFSEPPHPAVHQRRGGHMVPFYLNVWEDVLLNFGNLEGFWDMYLQAKHAGSCFSMSSKLVALFCFILLFICYKLLKYCGAFLLWENLVVFCLSSDPSEYGP